MAVADDPVARNALGLDQNSRVLLVNTESATDPGRYLQLVGVAPTEIARRSGERPQLVTF
jgi:diaminopropionate ammonia-lyase